MNNQKKPRLCKVGDKLGYFHCWEQYSRVIEPSPMIGGHPGGTFSQVYAIVEIDRKVERIDPSEVEFRNDMASEVLRNDPMYKVIAGYYGKEHK